MTDHFRRNTERDRSDFGGIHWNRPQRLRYAVRLKISIQIFFAESIIEISEMGQFCQH